VASATTFAGAVTTGGVLSTTYTSPVNGTLETAGVIAPEFVRSSRIVPDPVPVETVTIQSVPEPETLLIEAPVRPDVTSVNADASTPVTGSANSTA
jgi:hypothetical protein